MSAHGHSFLGPLKWAFVMNWGDRAFSLIFVVVLASILGPYDFGVVMLALVYIEFIRLFLEGGVQTALIQRGELRREHLDSAFWVNLVWCLVLAGLSVALSGWWARVNDVPELADVVKVLSILLVTQGLTIVQLGLFQRQMRFKALALRETSAVVVGGVIGLVLALQGAGVWALVAQQLGHAGMQLLLLWGMSTWRPSLRFSPASARELVRYSSGVFLANLGGFVNRRADALLIGLFFGPTVVGLYRLADRFVDNVLEVTLRPIGHVSLPFLSRLQHDRAALRDAVASFVRMTLIGTVPVMLIVAACSGLLVDVLPPEWNDAGDVLRLLAVVGIGKAVVFFTGPLLFAVARPHLRAAMLWVLAVLSAGVVVLVGVLLADASIRDQAVGMAGSRALYFLVVVIPLNIAVICWITGLRPRSLLTWLPAPLASGAAAIGAVAGLEAVGALDRLPPIPALVVGGASASLAAIGVLFALEPRARALVPPLVRRAAGREPEVVQAAAARPTLTTEWSARDR